MASSLDSQRSGELGPYCVLGGIVIDVSVCNLTLAHFRARRGWTISMGKPTNRNCALDSSISVRRLTEREASESSSIGRDRSKTEVRSTGRPAQSVLVSGKEDNPSERGGR